ncbi:phospholipase [Streptomyces angustmyceticus]|uniref:phospholipase n=1 Tax=Streptomyces angustmyceticus TaxID=285578 RepID=UPI0021AF5EDF|nr:phospholipase [Streptomyces angustmyceticus]
MLVKRSIFASVAAAGVLLAGPGAAIAADGAAAAKAGPSKQAKYQRLHQLTRSTTTSVKDWRHTRELAKSGIDRWDFVWSTDWCTRLVDKPGGFNFKMSCARHDFGYRNYKKMMGKTAFRHSTHERRIDKAFLFDMNHQCAVQPHKTEAERRQCRKTAQSYYDRVSG